MWTDHAEQPGPGKSRAVVAFTERQEMWERAFVTSTLFLFPGIC